MFVKVLAIVSLTLLLIGPANLNKLYCQSIKKIEWGTSYQTVLKKYKFHKNRGNLFYVQKVNGVDLYVTYYFEENKLSKIILDLYQTVGTNKYKQFETLISNSLSEKYGKPKEVKRFGESAVYLYKAGGSIIKHHKGKEGWSRVHYLEYVPTLPMSKKSSKLLYDLL